LSVPIARREAEAHRRSLLPLDHWAFAPVRWLLRRWRHATIRTVGLDEAEANFKQLIEEAEQGKPFAIVVRGKPMIKVARMEQEELERLPKAED
jgi:prevent-host-death family protein